MYRIPFLLFPLCLLAGPLNAEPRALSGDALIQFAIENHPQLRVAESESDAARLMADQAARLPDPEVSWGYFLERMDTRQTLAVRQSFPWPGTLGNRREAARLRGEAAAADFERISLETARSVRLGYWEWVLEIEELNLLRRHEALVEPMIDIVEARVASDRARSSELLRTELLLDQIQDSIESQKAKIDMAVSRLQRAIGLRESIAFDYRPEESLWNDPESVEQSPRPDPDHPFLLSYQKNEAAALAGEKTVRKENRPRWMLGAEWMENSGPAKDEVMVMVSFSLPVWRQANAAAVAESRARTRAAKAQSEDALAIWYEQWHVQLRGFKDAERKADRYQQRLIPRAESALEAEIEAYRSGRGDLVSLFETQRLLLDLEREALRARLELHLARAELGYLLNEPGYNPSIVTPEF